MYPGFLLCLSVYTIIAHIENINVYNVCINET